MVAAAAAGPRQLGTGPHGTAVTLDTLRAASAHNSAVLHMITTTKVASWAKSHGFGATWLTACDG